VQTLTFWDTKHVVWLTGNDVSESQAHAEVFCGGVAYPGAIHSLFDFQKCYKKFRSPHLVWLQGK